MIINPSSKLNHIKTKRHINYLNSIKKDNESKIEFISKKFTCECGSNITESSRPKHLKSKKHINYINSKKNSD